MKNSEFKYMLSVALGQSIWGFSYLFTKVGLQYTNTNVLLSMRFFIALLIMSIPLLLGKVKFSLKGKEDCFLAFLIFGLAHPLYYLCEGNGVLYTNSAFAGVLLAASPVFSILLGRIIMHEKPALGQILYCILPIVGVVLITLAGNKIGNIQMIGVLFLLATCFLQAVVTIANKKASQKASSFERTYILLLCCAIYYFFTGMKSVGFNISLYLEPLQHIEYIVSVLCLSIFCSVIALLAVNYGAKYLSIIKTSIFTSLTTVVSMLAGVLILHEKLNLLSILGALLILFGVYKVNTYNKS